MRAFLLFFLLFAVYLKGTCQVIFDKSSFDVGVITSPGFVDFSLWIYNLTGQNLYFMRIISDEGLASDIDQSIEAATFGTMHVRIQPEKRGRFKKEIALITHDRAPLFITFTGKCEFVCNSTLYCPDFTNRSTMKSSKSHFIRSGPKLTLSDTIHYAHIEQHVENANSVNSNNIKEMKHFYVLYDASLSMNEITKKRLSNKIFGTVLNELQPQDSVSLFIYSQDMKAIASNKGIQKEKMTEIFENVKNEGYTDGYQAIYKTLKSANSSLFEGKKIVIIITDGAFNLNSGQITSILSQDMTKNMQVTIVGIVPSKWAKQDLKLLAKDLGGHYQGIESENAATTFSLESR